MLTLQGLRVPGRLSGCDLKVAAGECVGLIGPNGAGKTTLLRAAQGLIPAQGYSSLAALPIAKRARACAFMPQGREIAWPMQVQVLIALGRALQPGSAGDAAVETAIAALDLQALRHRDATSLSGGEQARALLARAMAQDTPLLIADEPIAGLDPAAQIATMRLLRRLAGQGRGVIVSLHDLGLAAQHCTRLVLLHQGRIVADGPPPAVLTPRHLADYFGVTGSLTQSPDGPVLHLRGLTTDPRP
ncbi:ATP-binding cassette domain-containing protein [Paracoccus sp. DK608]|uniref:ATP-binding cassette domain-containing protein n=1 Tax=Paracoccus shanxieyensis TaxID=2675752 RepID=A0A6L6IZP7_9RHOB|nr:ABC transporter ATP-binding protein [Paracoccus shanxieyensis]MTH64044.1 ATP-binding cassette domain-containing protein [Paracoccus shanxieyensis]MTH86915.1 ATP-binding cassette domain-containing protein [Paracoccus shanxieyensis]